MDSLRNVGLSVTAAITLLAVASIVAALYEVWWVVVALSFGALIVTILTLLLVARNISHHARTAERNAKVLSHKLSARIRKGLQSLDKALLQQLDKGLHQQGEIQAKTVEAIEGTHRDLSQSQAATSDAVATLDETVSALQSRLEALAKSNRQHSTKSIRDSTRQVESLVHIYQRYPEVKLPMPNTGGFAIDSQALGHLLSIVEARKPQRILELGSGTSTIWLGYLCQNFGGKLITLDHLEHYLKLTRTAVERHELTNVIDTRLAPLEQIDINGTAFDWYSLSSMADLTDIDMLLVDGPPAATGPQARYPSLPKLIDRLAPSATVILDDAHRDDEAAIVESWLAAYPEFELIEDGTSRLAVLERRRH